MKAGSVILLIAFVGFFIYELVSLIKSIKKNRKAKQAANSVTEAAVPSADISESDEILKQEEKPDDRS